MKVLQVSDVHGSLEAATKVAAKAASYDLVLVVGDITHFGNIPQAEALLSTMANDAEKVVFVPGNCDHPSLLAWRPNSEKIINLHLNRLELEGYEFLGIGGGNVSPFNTLIEFTEKEFENMLTNLNPSSDKFILVSHTPPYGADADIARGKHMGSTAIKAYVDNKRPLAVCCGHIHEARSVSKIGETVVVNAGPAKEGNCAVLEIEGKSVKATLLKL
ncbi:MAG: metallophosphoesterase family protein [Candidatus Caldarchaeum sp.]|nr:metallophosphoesterase family protein [Candidatus Caldarchaeum sp.]